MTKKHEDRVIELAQSVGVLRSRDLTVRGIPREYLRRLCDRGVLVRVGRGLYSLGDSEPDENRTLIEAAKRAPDGILCLLTALRFHELTTQAPFEVWMALPPKAWRPRAVYPRIRFVRFSGEALTQGVLEHTIEGVRIRVYCPAKTVADLFKYRNKLGLDLAMEALRDCLRTRKATNDEIWRYAKVCRVKNVIRPYMEALQ